MERIIDGQYLVQRSFPLKDKDSIFVGVCRDLLSGEAVVIKAAGDAKMEPLEKESAVNSQLPKEVSEIVRMSSFKPAQAGMGTLRLASGEELNSYCYMVLPYHRKGTLLQALAQASKDEWELSRDLKR